MANIKISELEELTTVADDDVLPIVDVSENETKKVNKSNIIDGLIKENTDAVLTNVVSRNLLTNKFVSKTVSGVTGTLNKDNSITLNGTSTTSSNSLSFSISMKLKPGTYTLSSGNLLPTGLYISLDNKNEAMLIGGLRQKSFTIKEETLYNNCIIYFSSGITFDNLILFLQLEEGITATDYTPYLNLQELEKKSRNISINYSKVFNNTKMTISDTNNKNEISLIGNIVIFNIIGNIQSALSSNTYVEIGNMADLPITPSKNISFTVLNSTKMILGFGYFQSSTGNIRIKFSGAVSANDEIIIKTTYTI